jgi:uncharacterized membrane protein
MNDPNLEAIPVYDARPTEDVRPALVIYGLYAIAAFTAVPSIIAVVLAYIYREGAADWLQTHYRYQIRTFWLLCVYITLGALSWIFVIGIAILAVLPFWMAARCLVGWRALSERRPITRPGTWIF